MYTRCPECQTAFKITVAQLKVRDGLVRCGRCDSIFRADLRLFALPSGPGVRAPEVPEQPIAFSVEEEDDDRETLELGEKEIPVVTDLSIFQAPRQGIPTAVWALGTLLTAALLLAQFAFFYRNELAQLPQLRPRLVQLCELLRCRVAAPTVALVPELQQTRITPHPRYANALRLRAHLVNRGEQAQALPLLEVSVTDSNGQLLARRTFTPRDYLGTPRGTVLEPNVEIVAVLDVINPEGKAAGYEVQLFPQQAAQVN